MAMIRQCVICGGDFSARGPKKTCCAAHSRMHRIAGCHQRRKIARATDPERERAVARARYAKLSAEERYLARKIRRRDPKKERARYNKWLAKVRACVVAVKILETGVIPS